MGRLDRKTVRPGLRRAQILALLLLCSAAAAGRARAEGLSGYLELNYSKVDTATEDSTGQSTSTKSDSFLQRYSITLDKKVYPNLALLAGGFFERRATTVDIADTTTDTTATRLRPYVELRLRTPLYLAEAAYNRTEEKQKTEGFSPVTTIRETYSSALQWRPDGFPDVRLQYFHTNNYDKDRLFRDTTDDRYQLTSEYRPVRSLYLRYEGTVDEFDNRLEQSTTRELSHSGRVTFADRWWRGRVSVSSDYSGNRRETEITAGAGAVISFAVTASAGLSAIDDSPDLGALDPNPALIDGNMAAGSGIDLGLPPPGGDTRPRNLGLDFATGTEVNTLFVWIDRELPPGIQGAFSWQVYISADNLNWSLHQTVSLALFDTFFQRFEIRFSNVSARYVKVVTSPLSPAVPFANDFPSILVTEMQASLRRPAEEVKGTIRQTSHRYNLDIRTRIFEVPSVTYEFSYYLTKSEPSPTIYTVSNGLALSQQFSKVFSGVARVSREDGREREGDRVAYLFTASVTAVPLNTLRHSLVVSEKYETIEGAKNTNKTVFVQNTAKLYEGVDVNLGGGLSFQTAETGRKTDTTLINAGATLIPNPKMTITLYYTDTESKSSGGELTGETTQATQAGEANVSLQPVQTLYLFGSYRIEKRTGEERRTIRNYSATFSPFPDGTLHLNFFYNETIRSDDDARERTITPSLRWNITRKAYLDVAYSKLTTDSIIQKSDTELVSGTVRVNF